MPTSDPNNLRSARNPLRIGYERCERLACLRRVAKIFDGVRRTSSKLSHASNHMSSAKNPARFAVLAYILISIPAAFALMYAPNNLIVHEMLFHGS